MNPFKGFTISVSFAFLLIPFAIQAQDKNCEKIDVTVEIKDATNGSNGSITVTTGSKQPFTLHLIGKGSAKNTKDNQLNTSTGTIKNIKPGSYDLIIHYEDATYCTETRKVTVN